MLTGISPLATLAPIVKRTSFLFALETLLVGVLVMIALVGTLLHLL